MELACDRIEPDFGITRRDQEQEERDGERWPSLQPRDPACRKNNCRQYLNPTRDSRRDQRCLLERNKMQSKQGCDTGDEVEVSSVDGKKGVEPRVVPSSVEVYDAFFRPEASVREDGRDAYDDKEDEDADGQCPKGSRSVH